MAQEFSPARVVVSIMDFLGFLAARLAIDAFRMTRSETIHLDHILAEFIPAIYPDFETAKLNKSIYANKSIIGELPISLAYQLVPMKSAMFFTSNTPCSISTICEQGICASFLDALDFDFLNPKSTSRSALRSSYYAAHMSPPK